MFVTDVGVRNPAVFLIRIVMYTGLCACLGTLYWQIGDSMHHVQDRISILFFVAFLTFMVCSAFLLISHKDKQRMGVVHGCATGCRKSRVFS